MVGDMIRTAQSMSSHEAGAVMRIHRIPGTLVFPG
jgi:hypothetical protein